MAMSSMPVKKAYIPLMGVRFFDIFKLCFYTTSPVFESRDWRIEQLNE